MMMPSEKPKLRQRYESLSELAKDRMFEVLWEAIKWRGWAKGQGNGLAGTLLSDIADLFHGEQGVEFEEYT